MIYSIVGKNLKKQKININMPYVSDQQRKFFNANRSMLQRKGVNVDEWNEASKGKKLPEKKVKLKVKKK